MCSVLRGPLVFAQIGGCLPTWGISFLEEWDLLAFLLRHGNSFLTVEPMAELMGNRTPADSQPLRTLETGGFIRYSRSSQGIDLSRAASVNAAQQDCFELVVNLLKKQFPRRLVARRLVNMPLSEGWAFRIVLI